MTLRSTGLGESVAPAPLPSRSRLLRVVFWVSGALFVGIGTLGVFLPLLPSTVFFLLAAACFGKSSPRAYRWLNTNRWFGRHLREYREERGATVLAKFFSIATLWIGIGGSAYMVRETPWLEVLLLAIAMAVTVHLLSLRTVPR